MPLPTFNSFDLNDGTFITERVVFRGYSSREVIRGKINRREGVKLLATEFGEGRVLVEGRVIANSAVALQSAFDDMKRAMTIEEGSLVIEEGRSFRATVMSLEIPDEHYSVTTARFMAEFVLTDPFSVSSQVLSVQVVPSGIFTFSGLVNISGSFFNRPILVYTPPVLSGPTGIKQLSVLHTPTGQTVTISGLGGGGSNSLLYQTEVTVEFNDFTTFEGATLIGNSGGFARWEPGVNRFVVTASGGRFPGGQISIAYTPRWL